METNTTPMSAMAYTASHSAAKKSRKTTTVTTAVEVHEETVESNSEMVLRPFEELSNPEGYLYYARF